MDYETIDSQLKYDGKVLKVYSDKVKLPNGVVAVRETDTPQADLCLKFRQE